METCHERFVEQKGPKGGFMSDPRLWDWETKEKRIDVDGWKSRFEWVEECQASPDGERVAAVANIGEGEFTVCVNGEDWETPFEKIWNLRFTPDNRLAAIVSDAGEWTVAVDGTPWENRFGYVWDMLWNPKGDAVSVCFQQDMTYGMAVEDKPWEETFQHITDPAISEDGAHTAGTVQVIAASETDIDLFKKGIMSAALDGKVWDRNFVNVWGKRISPDGKRLAAEVRLSLYDYTIAVDGLPWEKTFQTVWEPCFHPTDGSIVAPVRTGGKWTLAKDGEIFWTGRYGQLWHVCFSPDGRKLAAIVSPKFGKWTVAVDDAAWSTRVDELVTDICFSPDGNHIGAVAKNGGKWFVLVDNHLWSKPCDMVWQPVFNADATCVAAKVEIEKQYGFLINDKLLPFRGEAAWNPEFNPAGTQILLRSIEQGVYVRRVLPIGDVL
jgi:WD40 repeat protein